MTGCAPSSDHFSHSDFVHTLNLGQCHHAYSPMIKASPHLSVGSSADIAFVLSCPGRQEELTGQPAAGTTGKNLELLLERIGPQLSIPNLVRSKITITNAWAGIEYKNKTNRSEASDQQIKHQENIDRLRKELQHITQLIVFCGSKAQIAAQILIKDSLLSKSVEVAFSPHLGIRGLTHSIKLDQNGQPIVSAKVQRKNGRRDNLKVIQTENTLLRIDVIVRDLLHTRKPSRITNA